MLNCALKFLTWEEARKVWDNKKWQNKYDGWIEFNIIHLINPPLSNVWFQQIADEFNVVFKLDIHKSSNKFLEPCIGEYNIKIFIPKDWKPKEPEDNFNEWDLDPYIHHED